MIISLWFLIGILFLCKIYFIVAVCWITRDEKKIMYYKFKISIYDKPFVTLSDFLAILIILSMCFLIVGFSLVWQIFFL
jgi:hypothetical protein